MQVKLRDIGSSVGIIIPKKMLDKLDLHSGDVVSLKETDDGFLVTAQDADFEKAMEAYHKVAKRHKNAFRELAK